MDIFVFWRVLLQLRELDCGGTQGKKRRRRQRKITIECGSFANKQKIPNWTIWIIQDNWMCLFLPHFQIYYRWYLIAFHIFLAINIGIVWLFTHKYRTQAEKVLEYKCGSYRCRRSSTVTITKCGQIKISF